ncbi:hypothetical protein [Streptomyces canus]|uniref:hypothetical protein n=1 Tax=Streptomyces canus TaxID=58343 RepID=UPI002DD9B242|nr:hypothetical protein [Streptomyces canus]WSD82872.1 hypothetical protein OG925_00195 [Streptomyces canus]WSD91962.1 hypothetical protein OG925_50285 [Streptomyces canus]WSD92549.1 hypothetical protein OG925_50675 [Streptomyces canus]
MNWRTYWQRLGVLVLLTLLVLGLIKAGMDPYLALAIAAGIVMLMKDFLRSDDDATPDQRPHAVEATKPAVKKKAEENPKTDAKADFKKSTENGKATDIEGRAA